MQGPQPSTLARPTLWRDVLSLCDLLNDGGRHGVVDATTHLALRGASFADSNLRDCLLADKDDAARTNHLSALLLGPHDDDYSAIRIGGGREVVLSAHGCLVKSQSCDLPQLFASPGAALYHIRKQRQEKLLA
jgi:hypothetical protein